MTEKVILNLEDFYERVALFNSCIGLKYNELDSDANFYETMLNQSNIIKEEVEELAKACTEKDSIEVLDGVIDVMVTALGALFIATAKYNTLTAANRVMDNNMTKFMDSLDKAKESKEYYKRKGVEAVTRGITIFDKTYYSVVNKTTGKLLKPKDFVPVNLEGLEW